MSPDMLRDRFDRSGDALVATEISPSIWINVRGTGWIGVGKVRRS